MKLKHAAPSTSPANRSSAAPFAVKPLARAVAVVLAMGSVTLAEAGPRVMGSDWMAAKAAARASAQAAATAGGRHSGGVRTLAEQRAAQKLKHSLDNLRRTANTLAAQRAAQEAAREAARQAASGIPDGLADGGLKVDTNPGTAGWHNADAPTQVSSDGHTTVTVKQTGDKAILNWETFNVSRDTTVDFQQQSNWAALNRVNDPQARPSQIQGRIQGEGTVMIANRNGVVFSGTSQVNARNLVAAAADISDEQFRERGIYFDEEGTQPVFTDAAGDIDIQAGARITTRAPGTSTQGGGYAMFLGRSVNNGGEIVTDRGQTTLAAGDDFYIRKGQGTEQNTASTTRGNEVATSLDIGSDAGQVTNEGLILSPEGDITLTGHDVRQQGVAVATTSVDARGTVHLLNAASDAEGSVTLGADSVTAVLIDEDSGTATDSRRQQLIEESADQDLLRDEMTDGHFDNLADLPDRRDQSRVEIVSGGDVIFEKDSLTQATGGQIAVAAEDRVRLETGAEVDVSGAVGVRVAMEANNVLVNVQSNELRDSPINRDDDGLKNEDIWIDRRELILVPAGTGGYEEDRWYTAGGLLEVSGYLDTREHSAREWAAAGGTVRLHGDAVISQSGSSVNLSGGTLNVAGGYVRQTWLMGADGRVYNAANAPGYMRYTGVYRGYQRHSERWGQTDGYYNPAVVREQRVENGYVTGRDAGQLIVSAPTAVLDGDIDASVYNGERQDRARDAGLDGYQQAQNSVALGGRLLLGRYGVQGLAGGFESDVRIGDFDAIADQLDRDAELGERLNTVWLDAEHLNQQGLGGVDLVSAGAIRVDNDLAVTPGGYVRLASGQVDVDGTVTARGGDITLTNIIEAYNNTGSLVRTALEGADGETRMRLGAEGFLDARGLWSNQRREPFRASLAHRDGGRVQVLSSQDVTLELGSRIDVSSGGAVDADGELMGGRGGDITLSAATTVNENSGTPRSGVLTLDGDLLGFGVDGGGTLTLRTGEAVVVGGDAFETRGLLAAGEKAPVDLTLLEEVVIAAGQTLPFDYQYERTVAVPGEALGNSAITISPTNTLTLAADWTIPESATGTFRVLVGGTVYGSNQTVPAGSVITNVVGASIGTLPADYIVPADAFPNGIPVQPSQQTLPAGMPLPNDVVFAAGETLAAGSVLSRDVRVKPVLQLAAEDFQRGFSHYDVNGHKGVAVSEGASIDVTMPVYRFRMGASGAATREGALEKWTPPLYQVLPERDGRVVRRGGASLTLRSEGQGRPGAISVGKDAVIQVDPEQSIVLRGGQTTVDGTLRARAGRIDILNPSSDAQLQAAAPARSVWIGENALLDVSGVAHTGTDLRGRRYGEVLNGGQVTLGSNLPEEKVEGLYPVNNQFIIVRDGAVIDVSGAQADLDLGLEGPTTVSGDAGGLAMRSNAGIYFDGELRAESGGDGAAGGRLDVMLETIGLPVNIGDERQTELRTIVVGEGIESGLPSDLTAGKDDSALRFGQARFDSEDIEAWGIDSLSLWAQDAILFEGDTGLDLGGKIELSAAVIGAAPETRDIQVALAAPYVRLAGRTELPTVPGSSNQQGTGPFFEFENGHISPNSTHESSRFSVSADLIDLGQGAVAFGGHGTRGLLGGGEAEVDLPGFARVTLDSRGDIRMDNAVLTAQHELEVIAERLYPVTHSTNNALRVGDINPDIENAGDAVLSIRRRGEGTPDLPPSVFGALYLLAPNIEQNGAVMAPLGLISVGKDVVNTAFGSGANPPYDVRNVQVDVALGANSITSISADGLILPYGYTTDGINYYYDGEKVEFDEPISDAAQRQRTGGGIVFDVATFLAREGAVVDTSAGGVLQGIGFRSGQRGSVNILDTALANAAPWHAGDSDAEVYAIVPGHYGDVAPIDPALAGPARVGERITIGAGVPGLPAGTYTLLPAEYALMPGGYRVELGASERFDRGVRSSAPGLYDASVYLGVAHTGLLARQPRRASIMSGAQVRRYGDFDETTLTQWVLNRQAEFGAARAPYLIPEDMRSLTFDFGGARDDGEQVFRFDGELRNRQVEGGAGGMVAFTGKPLEVVAEKGQGAGDRITLVDDDINALGATILGLGVSAPSFDGRLDSYRVSTVVRSGATLRAGTVVLGGQVNGADDVVVESGATIDTRGFEAAGWTAANGIVLAPAEDQALLVVGNDLMTFGGASGDGRLRVEDGAALFGEGSVALLASGGAEIGDISLGARDLLLGVEDINVGTDAALAQAASDGVLSSGWRLTQSVLDGLLRPADGPGIESLSFQASNSINFIGPVSLDTFDPGTGESSADLRFITPAIYGLGGDGDTATIRTERFTWSGLGYMEGADPVAAQPGPVIDGGAGTGTGAFQVDADEVLFGFNGPLTDESTNLTLERWMLGFADVTFNASDRISSERASQLSVYQRTIGDGDYQGGNLTLNAPVLTGQARSDMTFRAGGDLTVARPEGAEPVDRSGLDLGGRLTLDGNRVRIDGTVAAPSGHIEIRAEEDVELAAGSVLDVAGREVTFFDVTRHSFGGDVVLESRQGDVRQAAGATLDVSARGSDAGTVKATAANGQVALEGDLIARAGDQPDNGFEGGSIQVEGLTILDFVGLNLRLGGGGFDYRRDFTLGSGDLVIGDELRARHLSVTADGGSLTVAGTVCAGGDHAGSLRLAARDDLTIESGAVLDASGDTLKRDSHGGAIEGSNRATLDLTTRDGRLVLADGATLDVSAGGEARGVINLNAPRLGGSQGDDVAVDAGGPLTVRGAKRLAVNGFWTYDDAPVDAEDDTTQVVDEAYMDGIHQDSQVFVNGALANADLMARLAGLRDATETFQLRPGVEIVSATEGGNLRVEGDLDLANYRYGPDVDLAVRGSGTAGVFNLRAGGDLTVNGNISDGFGVPLTSPDSEYFLDFELEPGTVNNSNILLRDLVLREPLALTAGWDIADPEGALPFDVMPSTLGIRPGASVAREVVIISQTLIIGPLTADITLPTAVRDPQTGVVYGPGVVPAGTNLILFAPAGTRFGAGFVFTRGGRIEPTLLPAGTDLTPYDVIVDVAQRGRIELPAGVTLPKGFQLSSLESSTPVRQDIPALAPVLDRGQESWDIRMVAGADLASASRRAVRAGALAGDLVLDNPDAPLVLRGITNDERPVTSVIRTGQGDLELLAARDYRHDSAYGVYTAGNALPSGEVPDVARPDGGELGASYAEYQDSEAVTDVQAGFLTGGGEVLVQAGRNLHGYTSGDLSGDLPASDWLWTQGASADGALDAWWIHPGTYSKNSTSRAKFSTFQGIGALGGGNLSVSAGEQLGTYAFIGADATPVGALNLVVGASGWRDADGTVRQTGGGELRVSAGAINPLRDGTRSNVANLRGDIRVRAGAIGQTWQTFQVPGSNSDPRPDDLITRARVNAYGLLSVTQGDGAARLLSVGDAVFRTLDPTAGLPGAGLWTDRTKTSVFAAGGDITLSTTGIEAPSTLSLVASEGSIYGTSNSGDSIQVRPSLDGGVEVLAADSIYRLGLGVEAHEDADGVSGLAPTRFYAVDGDIYNLGYGTLPSTGSSGLLGRPAWIRAGRDIVGLGQTIDSAFNGQHRRAVAFGHNADTDVSLIEAGRDLIYVDAAAVGPGTLEVTAGRNFYQADRGWVRSMAGLSGDIGSGADIAINVGMGADGPDYQALIGAYLNPANLADPGRPLADQPDKVVKVYDQELSSWLEDRYGDAALEGTTALAYFEALSPEQQRIFLRELYYAELRAGGREYNDADGDRSGSYLRGRRVISTFLPKVDSEAGTSGYQGDYTMFSTGEYSGLVRTEGGGDIQMLVPGGDLIVGVDGVRPEGGDNGILTQGRGDIQLYSQGDIALGLSRIFTTYGGDIFAWSAAGDINAGRGAKTTLVYTPPRRVYDGLGNVSLSPVAPTTGAGIATLAPIPEVPPGDIDLIAPLGVIDAGEAGIRVSGNVNIAALQVVNAENIQVQGESSGLPAVARVNVGALTNATNAANSAVQAAEQVSRGNRGDRPSVITVEILGYGEERLVPEQDRSAGATDYRPDGAVRVLGAGALDERQSAELTEAERRSML
ncbi:filamentous hemagglutinin family protein [Alloalcanivorax sp. C16-2]|uniref:filamentous haemagglutinin family protein n=1 Tax=Alloalcanivorax sp. C16-2 TaxID=3390052 RepID=UPI00397107BD